MYALMLLNCNENVRLANGNDQTTCTRNECNGDEKEYELTHFTH